MTEKNPEHIAAARSHLAKVWTETQEYAQRYKLEKFLDKPHELNQWILRMINLLNKMQFAEQHHKYKDENVGKELIGCYVGKYAQGKFDVCFSGNGKYDEQAKRAFSGAVDVYAILNHEEFLKSMRHQQVPDDIIFYPAIHQHDLILS